ncbi:MAG: hypothetical protein J0J06_14950 [Sphingomonas sp.]|uniref:oligosaccharide flippase family protein n=1 Tax=Sphingomonas sp. TaxID=28214 RepID=UPI001ACBE571|nr:oligosaccharide flippase family protein [Sphingomonas sp.]MBN8816732.1 hypothetical protein [Sphingomonas sp.]
MDVTRSRSGISANLLIGVLSTAWSAIIGIIAIRWYVQLLGIESYGLIGFYATMQAAISILDLGLGATVNREVARGVALDDLSRVNRMIHSLQAIYGGVALLIGATVFVAAPFIAHRWLGASAIDSHVVEWSIRLMGVIAAVRWPIGLFQGALVGLQRSRVSYQITATMTTISNVGAIVLLYAVSPTLWTYFGWQVACSLVNLLWMRHSAWRELGTRSAQRIDADLLRALLIQSVMISGVAVSGLLLSQLDKLVVSGFAPLADFGRYSLAGMIASALVILLIPTFNVIYPRMSGLAAAGKTDELVAFYRLGTRVLMCGLIPVSASAVFYAYDLLFVWTGNASLAAATAPIVRLLIVGSTLNGIMHFPYTVQLATAHERLALYINLLLIAVMVPATLMLASRYGIVGGAIGWIAQQSLYFVVGVTITHRFILKGLAFRWLFVDLVPPVLGGIAVVAGGRYLAALMTDAPVVRLLVASVAAIVAVLAITLVRTDTRTLYNHLRRSAFGRNGAGANATA